MAASVKYTHRLQHFSGILLFYMQMQANGPHSIRTKMRHKVDIYINYSFFVTETSVKSADSTLPGYFSINEGLNVLL